MNIVIVVITAIARGKKRGLQYRAYAIDQTGKAYSDGVGAILAMSKRQFKQTYNRELVCGYADWFVPERKVKP